jgi:predicted nucleotidyltransferase
MSETIRIYNKTLEPNLWDENQNLRPEIRLKLLKIANDFYKSTDFKSQIVDILLLGSTINYNWTPESDIDIHIVIDVQKEGLDVEHFRKTLDCLGSQWNKEHDIEIHGHPVETYLQDISEKNSSPEKLREHASMFSLLKNKWIVPPKHEVPSLNKEMIRKKFYEIKAEIDKIIEEKNIDGLKSLMKTIRDYRNKGLEGKDGEFSTENIVFKALRHTGILEKLKDAINSIYDTLVSIKERQEYLNNLTSVDENFLNGVIQETMEILEERDRPYIIIGAIDDGLKIAEIIQEKISKPILEYQSYKNHAMLYYGNFDIDPNTPIHWRYRSDINELSWWSYPSEEQSKKVKLFLFEKYKVDSPRISHLKDTDIQYRKMFDDLDYKYKAENIENFYL